MDNKNTEKVKKAMLATIRYPWEHGVCMQAMYEAGEMDIVVAMAHDAVLRSQADGRLAVINDNVTVTDPAANGIGVLKAYEITGEQFYLDAANRLLDYLMNKAPRTGKDILCHTDISFYEGFSAKQIWVDSVYMAPPFLAAMGKLDEANKQIKGIYDYLLDGESGLLRHIYDADKDEFVRDKLWTTGNTWALMGMAAVAEAALEVKRIDIANELKNLSQGLLDAMLKYQLFDGRFHDILNEDDSFVDGAGAMAMAAYIYRSVYNKLLPASYVPYADKVLATMENFVDKYGIIHGVCGCPNFTKDGTSAESMAFYVMMHAWKEKIVYEGKK